MIGLPLQVKLAVAGVALALAGVAGWQVRDHFADAEVAAIRAEYAQAAADAAQERARQERLDREQTDKRIADYVAQLDRSQRAARDLASRLRAAAAARCPVPQAPAAGGADGAGPQPGDAGGAGAAVDAALGRHLEACAADAAKLTALQEWARE